MRYTLTSIVVALLISCCGTKETTTATTQTESTQLKKGTFKVIELASVNLGMVQPTIIVGDDQKISGYAGCNNYTTNYTMTATSLNFGNMAMTKVACVQGMEEERKFAEAMSKVNRHTLENGKLTLYQDQTVLIKAESTTM